MQLLRYITTTETPGGQATLSSISKSTPIWDYSGSESALVIPFSDLPGIDSAEISGATEKEINQKGLLAILSSIHNELSSSAALSVSLSRSNVAAGVSPSTLRQTFSCGATFYMHNIEALAYLLPLPTDNIGSFVLADAFPNSEVISESQNPSAEGIWVRTQLSSISVDARRELWRIFNFFYMNLISRSSDLSSAIVGKPSVTPSGVTPTEDNVWSISSLNENMAQAYSFFQVSKSINFEYILENDGTWDLNITTS